MMKWYRTFSVGAAICLTATLARGQQASESEVEKAARLERRGAGVVGGTWMVRGLSETNGVSDDRSPALEGYMRKGLDRHLAWENTIGFWRRSQRATQAGGFLGGGGGESIESYVIPMFTALKLFPVTSPGARLEPYVDAGAGLVLGIDDRETTSGGLFGTGSGTAFVTGFGFKSGLGAELRFSRAFGVSVGARYQWIRFMQDLGGDRTFRGFGVSGGLSYRFQYK